MDNLNSFNKKLTQEEEIRFSELADKILERESLTNVLSTSEKEEFFQLLQKINLFYKEQNSAIQEKAKASSLISLAFTLFSAIAIILLISIAPIITIIISQNINQSLPLTIFAAIGALFISILGLMAFFGKFQWTWFFGVILMTFFLTLLFSIL